MTTFQDREQAFEAKFAHDEAFRFLVGARRDKLFARWAAERLTLSDEAGHDLLAAVLAVRDGPHHDEELLKLVAATFAARGTSVQTHALAAALDECAARARQQLLEVPASDRGEHKTP